MQLQPKLNLFFSKNSLFKRSREILLNNALYLKLVVKGLRTHLLVLSYEPMYTNKIAITNTQNLVKLPT